MKTGQIDGQTDEEVQEGTRWLALGWVPTSLTLLTPSLHRDRAGLRSGTAATQGMPGTWL